MMAMQGVERVSMSSVYPVGHPSTGTTNVSPPRLASVVRNGASNSAELQFGTIAEARDRPSTTATTLQRSFVSSGVKLPSTPASFASSSSFNPQVQQMPPKRSVAEVHPMQSTTTISADSPVAVVTSGRSMSPQAGACDRYSPDAKDKMLLSPGSRQFKPPVPKKPGNVSIRELSPPASYPCTRTHFAPGGKTSTLSVGLVPMNADHQSVGKLLVDDQNTYGRDRHRPGCKDAVGVVGNDGGEDSLCKANVALLPTGPISYLNELLENLLQQWDDDDLSKQSSRSSAKKSHQDGDDVQFGARARGGISSVNTDLDKEKVELIARLSRKLEVLEDEKRAIDDEIRSNEVLGAQVRRAVENSAANVGQKQKFLAHVDNVENVTDLLLRLSRQLARVQGELARADTRGYATDHEKQVHLQERFRQLLEQLHDAKEIKEVLDQRSHQVVDILRSVLTENQLADYQYFIQMKSKLLIDGDEIENKIKFGKSQREALQRSLS